MDLKQTVQKLSDNGWDGLDKADKDLLKSKYDKQQLQSLSDSGWTGLSDETKNHFRSGYNAPEVISDRVQSSPMSSAELEQFYKENPDLRDELLQYAPSLPSVQANADIPLASPRGSGPDALSDIWRGLTGKGSIVQTGAPAVGNFVKENPGLTAAGLGSAIVTGGSSMGLLPALLVSGGMAGAGEAVDKTHPFTEDPNEWKTHRLADNIVDVGGSGVGGMIGEGFGRGITAAGTKLLLPEAKYAEELARYNKTVKAPYEAKINDINREHYLDQNTIRYLEDEAFANSNELRQPLTEDEIIGGLPGARSTPEQRRLADNLENVADDIANEELIRGIRQHMYMNDPKYDLLGGRIEPTNQDALEFYAKLKHPPVYPERPLPFEPSSGARKGPWDLKVRDVMGGLTPPFMGNMTVPGSSKIPYAMQVGGEAASRVLAPTGEYVGGHKGEAGSTLADLLRRKMQK